MPRIQKGDRLPAFIIDTDRERQVPLHSLLKGTTILRVLRYVGCPTCRIDIHDIVSRYEEFTKRGAQVLVVMQSAPESLNAALNEEDRKVTYVCDTDQRIYRALAIDPAKTKEELIGCSCPPCSSWMKRGRCSLPTTERPSRTSPRWMRCWRCWTACADRNKGQI